MRRQTWTDLATFAAIAEAGSFTRAAAVLGVSPSALSHAMRAMEERVGMRLLNRSTRSIAPTPAGLELLETLRPAIADLDERLDRIGEAHIVHAGRIRISAHRTAAMLAIMPRLPLFSRKYPKIQVELSVQDGLIDIVGGAFDLGLRHEHVLDQDMISVRVSGPQRSTFVASPDYWSRHPKPRHPKDLLAHQCLAYRLTTSGAVLRWRLEKGEQSVLIDPPAILISNDVEVIMQAARGGMGVAWLLEAQIKHLTATKELVPALADWAPVLPPNYIYYPSRRQMTAALRAFIDAMRIEVRSPDP